MKVDYIEEVEKCAKLFKCQIEEEQREIQDAQEKVLGLLNAFFKMDSSVPELDSVDQMKVSFPDKSIINSLFTDDLPNGFLFNLDHETKRKRLASERRAEYNAFLEKKESELASRRKMVDQTVNIIPKSILESVDYEKVLAKRREEELKFRSLNYAEHSMDDNSSEPETASNASLNLCPSKGKISQSQPVAKPPVSSHLPREPLLNQRTGGGGAPVMDSLGNLIAARGYKTATSLGFLPSMQEDAFALSKKLSYREELRKQIEERRQLAALEKERAKQMEEQIAQRIEEQRRQMQRDYDEELRKMNQIKQQRQQERLWKLEEFQKREAAIREKRIKESQLPEPVTVPAAEYSVSTERSSSPPVPAVRSKVIMEKTAAPSLTAATQALNEVEPKNIFSSLAEIRRTIMQDQQNLKKGSKESYEVMNRRTVSEISEDYDEDLK